MKIIYNLGNKFLTLNCINGFVRGTNRTASVNTLSQRRKQEACFACASRVWLAVNHNTSVTSGEWVWCSKRIARAIGLAVVNQICVIHEAINGCKNLKIY